MRTWQILLHKVLGLFAGFFNIVLAASVLDPSVSYFYLTVLSASQIFMAFSGFGLTHKLVTMSPDEAQSTKAWPWFAMTQLAAMVVFAWLFFQADAKPPTGVLVFTSLLLLLLLLAEWLRAAMARQVGFVIYNLTLLISALVIFWQRDISVTIGLLPLIGCVILLWEGRDFYTLSGQSIRPKLADLVRALRVASVNQYYNLIVLLFPLVGLQAEALGVLLVFRFAIFYNWQNFFWLRFGHKQLNEDIEPGHKRQNRKFILMNIVALTGTAVGVGLALTFDLFRFVPSGVFDAQFAYLLLYFAGLRVLINLCFPFEVFLLYRSTLRVDLILLAGSLISFVILAFFLASLMNPFLILTLVELVWLSWRLISWWVLKKENKNDRAI